VKTYKEKIPCRVILIVALKSNTSICHQNNLKKIIYKNNQQMKNLKSLRARTIKTIEENRDQDLDKNKIKNQIQKKINKIINNKK